MKKLFLLLPGFFLSVAVFSQGTILGFTIEPQSPTESDFVKVYAGLSFTSGGCDLDHKNHTTIGTTTEAYSHHCIGMLTYICQTIDTFELGYLPTGTHKFRLGLTSGGFPVPCTPGIVEDDRDSTSFFVSTASNIFEIGENEHTLKLHPNPASSLIFISLSKPIQGEYFIKITDILGKEALTCPALEAEGRIFQVNVSTLSKGVYFSALYRDTQLIGIKKFIKQ